MASNYAISVESDARDADSYKLRVSRDGRTWNAVKDQAQLDAFHARATRLGATNGVAFSTKPSELEAYLSDVARHASSSEKEELVSSFLEADDDERGAERAFLEELAAVVKRRVFVHHFVEPRPGTPSTRRSSHESVAAMASPPSNHTTPLEVTYVTQRTNHTTPSPRPLMTQRNAGPRRRRAIKISRPLRFICRNKRRLDGCGCRSPTRARPGRARS